jgi:hypothetical protein
MGNRAGLLCVVAALAGGVLIAGCGDGDDETLTKEEYIQRADQICQESNDEIEAAAENVDFTDLPKFINETVLPKLEESIAKIRELPIPAGDEETLNSIYDRVEDAIQKFKDDPASLSDLASGKIAPGVEKDSRAYGFKVCGAGA